MCEKYLTVHFLPHYCNNANYVGKCQQHLLRELWSPHYFDEFIWPLACLPLYNIKTKK